MINIDIFAQSGYRFDRGRIRQTMEKILTEQGMTDIDLELSLTVVGERKMRELHKKYMETDEVTDVLSFPLDEAVFPDGVLRLGDIAICYPVAVQQAREDNKMVDDEIEFLAGHGLMHLMGIHHAE
jgi:probable rRNA maturation factor